MATAVVCDYDPVLRAAASTACERAGLEVVAETDRGGDALTLVERFGVDVLVLDTSLNDGSGETVLRTVLEAATPPEVVVFTAYTSEPYHLVELGARDVVPKPDVERLTGVLTSLALSLQEAAEREGQDRRRGRRRVPAGPDIWRSPSGIARADDLLVTAEHTEPGDAVLVVQAVAAAESRGAGRPVWTAGELLCQTLRVQDIVHELPQVEGWVAVLRGGDEEAPRAALRRLVELASTTALAGQVRGVGRRVDELGLIATIDRAVEDLQRSPARAGRGDA